jgi:hypothetical protein
MHSVLGNWSRYTSPKFAKTHLQAALKIFDQFDSQRSTHQTGN